MNENLPSRASRPPGETPESLGYLQAVLAHLIVAGAALILVSAWRPAWDLPPTLLLVLALGGLAAAVPKALAFRSLARFELVVLGAVASLALLLGAVAFAALA